MRQLPTASQTVGPFFAIGMPPQDAGFVTDTVISGTVFDGDGAPVGDALLEIWCLSGRDTTFRRIATDSAGRFAWQCARATERVFAVHLFARGLLAPLLTRVYLPSSIRNDDPVLANVPPTRRATLIAEACGTDEFHWDVRLQETPDGRAETVFFACVARDSEAPAA